MFRRRKNIDFWVRAMLLALALLVIFLPTDASARAGGGGHFGGGGGGGFGGGGHSFGGGGGGFTFSGGRGGNADWQTVVFIIVVFVIIICIKIAISRSDEEQRGEVIQRSRRMASAVQEGDALRQIQSRDPAFDTDAFYKRASAAFYKIQAAWCGHNLSSVRPFISDGIFERFTLQIMEQRDMGYHDQMDDLRIEGISLAEAVPDALFDALTVRVAASAADYEVSLKDGKPMEGVRSVEPFVEFWSFLRRRGVPSVPGRLGLIEGHCPNCGVAVEMNQSANCSHCKAVLRSGEYDWVLVEITQESEWEPTRPAEIPGVSELRGRDPEFNVQSLEDRASVMFWRKAMADRLGNIGPLKKIALPEYCDEYASQLKSLGRGFYGECGVGSVETTAVIVGEPMDRALVAVQWSGTIFMVGADGKPQRGQKGAIKQTLFVLGRKSGAQSDAGHVISSAHCPQCGAPESNKASNACEFCGIVLNDGSHSWVLMDAMDMSSPGAKSLIAQATSAGEADGLPSNLPPARAGMFAWMLKVAMADGSMNEKEQRTLEQTAQRYRFPKDRLQQMMSAAIHGQIDSDEPANRDEARLWLGAMAAEAIADGIVTPTEKELLCRVGAKYGLVRYDIETLIRQQKMAMFQEARSALRTPGTGEQK